MINRSLLILAGGIGRRMEYVEKSLIPFRNKTIIEYMVDSLKKEVDEIIISVRDTTQKNMKKIQEIQNKNSIYAAA